MYVSGTPCLLGLGINSKCQILFWWLLIGPWFKRKFDHKLFWGDVDITYVDKFNNCMVT